MLVINVMCPLIFVHTQLSDSERSMKQLQQSIDRSQPRNDVEMSSLQESLRRAKQEITRLQNSNQEQVKFKYCRFSVSCQNYSPASMTVT